MNIELIDMNRGRPSRFSFSTTRKRSIYFQLSPRGQSEKAVQTADDEQSSSFQKLILRATELMLQKKWESLIELCDQGLQNHQDAQLYNMKGRAYGKLGHLQQKIQLTTKATQLNPDCPVYHRNLGSALYKLQRYELALASHLKATQFQANNPINHHNVGAVYFRLRLYQHAIDHFTKSISLNKYQAHSFRWLGNCYRELKELGKALECYRRAYDLSEKDIDRIEVERLEKEISPWRVFFNHLLFC